MNRWFLHAYSLLLAAAPAAAADLQLFGDVYLPQHVLEQTATTAEDPRVFTGVRALMASAEHNVVNFEGVATSAFVPLELKRFLLKMPLSTGPILKAAGVTAVTLANNHAMDYGYQGLFDTLSMLREADIAATGAGRDAAEAARPLLLTTAGRLICLQAYSRTLPESFWATATEPGTAHADLSGLVRDVKACAAFAHFTVVSFHWGAETANKAADYQRELAKAAVAAGADLVVGHHPHVLQEIEIIGGKPVFYSLGNFAFGTLPTGKQQEGMAVRVTLPEGSVAKPQYELVPLQVRNSLVNFRPRPLQKGESDPIEAMLPAKHPCRWVAQVRSWRCVF
jgi:poly-gamma-glutamate synthesis protein (capsule biosynthesis protein)